MTKAMQALTVVILSTLIGGALGGLVGRFVGQVSPSFVRTLAAPGPRSVLPASFQAAEFGLGLGIVSGLFFGAGTGLFAIVILALRDVWVARLELTKMLKSVVR
jgi:hypothetical protein